jgi:5'-3' exonuclease|tara:strand:+ start:2052 stop:3083 length:1032 start_codon:yes stop_codon:yes gene_type:complete
MSNDRYLSILNQIKKHGGKIDGGEPNDKILVIDGLNTFIRVFSVIPTLNDDGIHIGGIVGFLKSVGYAIKMLRPTRCIIVFDGKGGSTRRRKVYSEYKNKRKTKIRLNRANEYSSVEDEHQSMLLQLQRGVEYLENLPLTLLSIDNIEADDTIAYITEQVLPKNKIVIMSTDKDFLQLVDERVSVWSPTKKKIYTPKEVYDDFGVNSKNLILARIIDGDKSDNIPGIKGYGMKTILKKIHILSENDIVSYETFIKFLDDNELDLDKDVLLRNYYLMQLHEVDISSSAKLKIQNRVNESIPTLVKFKFQKMFLEDKLYTALPNLNSWLATTFNRLNQMAEKTHG